MSERIDQTLEAIEREVAERRLAELSKLTAEREKLLLVEFYPTMHSPEDREHAKTRLPELRQLIEEEEKRLASLRGEGFAEQQLENARQVLGTNLRMAAAAEASAATSADAAQSARLAGRWAAVAAIASLLAALGSALAAILG